MTMDAVICSGIYFYQFNGRHFASHIEHPIRVLKE